MMYDKSLIGKKIATGGDRKVYLYGDNEVIKFSSLSFLMGDALHRKLSKDYATAQRYFGDYVVPITDVSTPKQHVEIQSRITGELLRKHHADNPDVKRQIREIAAALDAMVSDGLPLLDLIGNGGVLTDCLSNIMVDSDGTVHIIDTTLLEGKSVLPLGALLELFLPFIISRQQKLLRSFLGE